MNEPTHKDYADSLRKLADFYEANLWIPLPLMEQSNYSINSKDDAVNLAKALGTFKKIYQDDLLTVKAMFGCIEARFVFTRDQICEAKVVGQKYQEERVIPAHIIPGRMVDVVEWDCKPLSVPEEQSNG